MCSAIAKQVRSSFFVSSVIAGHGLPPVTAGSGVWLDGVGQAGMYGTDIFNPDDNYSLQKGIDALQCWSQQWLLKLNIAKCNIVSFGRSVDKSYLYSISHNNQNTLLDRKDSFKDLGVVIDEKLTFRDHMHDKINKAYAMLGIIKRNFNYLTISSFVLLYKCMVRFHLDYCSSVWVPYKKVGVIFRP